MPSPDKLLPWLLGGAIGIGGILQGLHWKSSGNPAANETVESQLRLAQDEIALLQRENQSLRSLAQGGGELAVPRELIDRTESENDLRFLSSPVVHQIAIEELRDRVSASFESRFGPAGIDDRQEAYRRIGWLGPEHNLLAQLTIVSAFGRQGWFDEVSGEAWVTDRFEPESIPDQAALSRLLTRILLHQHFPPPPGYPGDEAARAREALHEGAAAGSEARFYAASARSIGFVPMTKNAEVEQLLASLPAFIQGLSSFPLTEGKGLADSLFVEGNESLHKALRNPPQSTRTIIDPAKPAAAGPLDLPEVPEEPYLDESAGQLGLRLWLETNGDAGELPAARENDRYLLIPDGEDSTAVLWDIELASPESAGQLEAAALALIASRAGTDQSPAPGETLITPAKRRLRISRPSPTRVRFINAATPEFLQSIP